MSKGVAYQNKDIEFKLLSESFKERSFKAYGLDLPRIKEVLPTNLPSVVANEMRMDNLFLLEDDTLAIVDYESENRLINRVKYINYIGRVLERWFKEYHNIPNVRMIVIYTGDIDKADEEFNIECMTLRIEQVFVKRLPVEEIYKRVSGKLYRKERLTEQELMQLIILPLAEKGEANKQKRIMQVIELAKQISNEEEQKLVLSGLLVVSDKFISDENINEIRRRISMTKIIRSIYEDAIKEGKMEGKMEGKIEGAKEEKRKTAEKLLKRGNSIEIIKEITDLSEEEIKEIKIGQESVCNIN